MKRYQRSSGSSMISMTTFPMTYCFVLTFTLIQESPYSFFFNDTATTEIYTLSLHDALPISLQRREGSDHVHDLAHQPPPQGDRKSTRLNSSHGSISYAVFGLKKKKIDAWRPVLLELRRGGRLPGLDLGPT